jgi:hypothetical protein
LACLNISLPSIPTWPLPSIQLDTKDRIFGAEHLSVRSLPRTELRHRPRVPG